IQGRSLERRNVVARPLDQAANSPLLGSHDGHCHVFAGRLVCLLLGRGSRSPVTSDDGHGEQCGEDKSASKNTRYLATRGSMTSIITAKLAPRRPVALVTPKALHRPAQGRA